MAAAILEIRPAAPAPSRSAPSADAVNCADGSSPSVAARRFCLAGAGGLVLRRIAELPHPAG